MGAPTYDFAKISEKLHTIEKILGRRGVCFGCAPLDPPLLTVNNDEMNLGDSQTIESLLL